MGSLAFNQIKLTGFKSFVEPTDFIIQPGLTGIVGPNGCGKSNLLEAIRWVMGANSAKAMRGAAMEDVIFAGTKQRPGRNQAHVTLTIDNSARIAPPMFNDDETLEITRIITKGKGSTYKVNNKTVRAKDVQLLFADASTGANSPALVRQGQINELIAAKPSNRRRILEEAAGISGLHSRRHEAELRLRAAETNLSRLDDILGQIESQLLSLRRQSRQASRYKRLAGEIHEYKALLWLKRWVSALDTLAGSQDALKACENQVADTATKASELTRQAAELNGLLEPKREEQIIAAAVLGRLNAAKDALEQDEHAANTEIRKLKNQIEQLAADLARETGIVEDASAAEARLTEEFEKLNAVKDTSAALDAAADEAEAAIAARSSLETDYNELTRKAADQNARRDSAARELSQIEHRLDRLTSEDAEAKDKLAAMEKGGGSTGNLFAAGATDALAALEAARETEQNLAAKKSDAETQDQAAREALSDAKQGLSSLTAEQSALERVVSRGANADWPPALSALDVKKGYDIVSLARNLGPGQRLVTTDGHVARWDGFEIAAGAETSAAIKLKQQTRLTELAGEIETAQASVAKAQAAFETAREARNAANEAARTARQALPDLERRDRAAQAALAQYETDVARESAQKRSLEDRLERLEREIKELTTQQAASLKLNDELAGGEDVSAQQEELSAKLTEARARADEASGQYRSLKNEAEARAQRLASVEKERANWARRSETATARVTNLQGRQDAAKMSLSAATDGPDQFAERRNTLFRELETAENRRTTAADVLAQAEAAFRETDHTARAAETAAGEAREARAAAQARQAAAEERIAETKERKLERLSKEREKMGGVNLRADEEAAEQEERLSAMNDERQDLEAAIARLREGIDELNTEGRTRLLNAFDIVNGHFGRLFTTLFGGGEASLALTESDDPLEAGLSKLWSVHPVKSSAL